MNKPSLLSASQTRRLMTKLPWPLQLLVVGVVIALMVAVAIWPDQLRPVGDLLWGVNSTTNPSPTPSPPLVSSNVSQTVDGQLYQVSQVVDGDTIKIEVAGQEQTVRLLGIDTPETVDPRQTVECFGREASAMTKSLVEQRKVKVETDASQGNSDTYGRLLRYVYLPDGQMVNLLLIEQGYAFEYTYGRPYKYQAAFKAAQIVARSGGQGLWADSSCNGQR